MGACEGALPAVAAGGAAAAWVLGGAGCGLASLTSAEAGFEPEILRRLIGFDLHRRRQAGDER